MTRMTQNKTLNTQLMKRIPQCSKQVLILILFLIGCFTSYSQIQNPASVPFNPVPGSTLNLRGELTMIGNNIVAPSRFNDNTPRDPDQPYFGTLENGQFNEYAYVDIDNDPSTFSSSSADFTRKTTCGIVRYAGLYWSATYIDMDNLVSAGSRGLIADYNDPTLPDPRPAFNTVKFRAANTAGYVTIPPSEVRIIYDGYPGSINNPNFGPNDMRPGVTPNPAWPNINNGVVDYPYHCYADVTQYMNTMNPDGTYFVADQRASVGVIETNTDGGFNTSDFGGGWTLVIIYEDPSLPNKFISTNNGLGAVSGSTGDVSIQYSGFTTLPPGLPVNARYGIGSYEGDRPFDDDIISIEPTTVVDPPNPTVTVPPNSTDLDDGIAGRPNLIDNFFDSSISVDGIITTTRNPASTNTLGYDIDIFDIQNEEDGNDLITNNQTEVNFRLRSDGDKYQVFVQSFEVEIIEPELIMTKRILRANPAQTTVDPIGFDDITDLDVNFNEEIFYDIRIQNVGNEDVLNTEILDILPVNIDFVSFEVVDTGITPTYDPTITPATPNGSVLLEIADSAVVEGAPAITFRFRVRVVEDCAALRDACSNEIENVATSQYVGAISGLPRGDSSIVERDVCNFNVVGASTFLINDGTCFNEAENARLCRDRVTLQGGDGFTTYEWTREDDPSDSSFPRDTQDIIVTEPGTYVVTTTSTDCRGTVRRFNVLPQSAPDNPIAQIIQNGDLDSNPNADGNVRVCPDTDEEVAEIFLCGSGVTLPLDSNLGASTVWERLRNGACPGVDRDEDCPTEDSACDAEWEVVFTGEVLTLDPNNTALFPSGDTSGEYRIRTTVDGDCPDEVYFNVFQSNFDPVIEKIRDIICAVPGALQVTGASSQYEYQLFLENPAPNPPTPIGTPQSGPGGNVFDNITTAGSYFVSAREIGSPLSACSFPSNSITINAVNPNVDAQVTDQPVCASGDVNSTGTIEVTITGGLPTYRYVLTGPPGFTTRTITGSSDPTADFTGLIPGDYVLNAYSDDDNSATSCFETRNLTIDDGNPFAVSITPVANLECNPDYNPTPDPIPPGDVGPFDDDQYIAIVDITITSPSPSGSYDFSTNSDFSLTQFYINPIDTPAPNTFRFRFADTDVTTGVPFTIYVRDSSPGAGCVTEGGTTINPLIVTAATASSIDPACFNELGRISVNVTAGSGPFTFLIDGNPAVPATSPASPDGLGIYTFANIVPTTSPVVTVQDNINCDTVLPAVNFTVPDEIVITLGTITPLSCNANPNASIVVTNIEGGAGAGNYEYSLDSPTGTFTAAPATPFTINNVVGSGTHVVYVRNVVPVTVPPTANCLVSEPFDVDPLLVVDSVTVTPDAFNCTAQTTDVILSAAPATATYLFRVTPNPATGVGDTGFVATTTYTFQNTTPYTVEARRTDSNCENNTIFTPPNIPISEIVNQRQTSPVSCNGGNDGAFEFTVTNSTEFNYTITGPGTNITVNGNTTNPVVITGSVATPIVAGMYTISITDTSIGAGSTGCTDTETVTITQPDPIIFSINPTNQDCATNLNEVSISNVMGGNGPAYTYQVSHPTNGTFGPAPVTDAIDNIPNVPVGDPVPNYTITVFDVTGICSAQLPLTITPLTPLQAEIADTSDVCLDDAAVSFTINVDPNANGSVGNPPYNYTVSRDGTLVQTNTTIAGPPIVTNTFSQAGTYEIVFSDSENCSVTLTEVVAPLLTITARRVNDLSCNPTTVVDIDGRFELTIAGGTANYDITFENTTTTTTGNVALGVTTTAAPIFFDSPDVGNYVFTVTDRAGSTGTRCVATDTGELTVRVPPTITDPNVDLTCDGDRGTVTITVTGPEAEYFVQFDDNDATTVDTFVQTVSNQIQIPNLPAGVYNYVVRDSRGCRFPETVSVISPGPIAQDGMARIDPITCDDTLVPPTRPGSIEIDIVDRGALTYTYTLVAEADVSTLPLVPVVVVTPTVLSNPQTIMSNTVVFNPVNAGRYYIFVEDENGCAERLGPYEVASDPNDLTIFAATTATCPDLVTLDVQVVGGVGPFSIEVFDGTTSIAGPFGPPLNGTPTPSSPPDAQERNQRISNLPFNTRYRVLIIDDNTSCSYVEFVDPKSPPSEPALIDIAVTPISCDDGDPVTPLPADGAYTFTIDVSSLGTVPPVTQVNWAVFEFGTNNPATGTNTTGSSGVGSDVVVNVTDLPAGLYYVDVQEFDGTQCPVRVNFEIEVPDPIVTTADDPTVAICDTEVTFSVTTNGGTPTGGINTTDEGYRYHRVRRGTFIPPALPPLASFTLDATTINDAFIIDPTDPLDLQWDIYTVDDNNCIVGPLEIDINVIPGPSITANPGVVSNPCALSDFTLQITTTADLLALNSDGNIFYGYDDGTNPIVFEAAPPGNYTYTFPSPGTYALVVRDNNGCEVAPRPSITIFPPIEITAAFVTPPDCTSIPPLGVIEATRVSSGSGAANHTYTLLDRLSLTPVGGVSGSVIASGYRFEDVPAGDYLVRVEDSGMGAPGVICPFDTPVSIEAPTTPDIDNTVGVTDASCNAASPAPAPNTGLGNGRIEVSLNGGLDPTATYQYAIITAPVTGDTRGLQDSNIFNNLAPDTYTVRVVVTELNGPGATDDVVCIDEKTYTVNPAPAIVVSLPAVSPFSCDATDNSEQFPVITMDISGGTLTAGGNYRISYTRPAPLAPVVDEVVVDADAGAAGIQFETIASVAGVYNFTIKDSNNCEITTSATVNPFIRMSNETVTVTAPGITCVTSEEVTVTVEGGTGPFTFEEITGTGLSQAGITFDNIPSTPVAETGAVFTLPNAPDESRDYRFRITDTSTDCFVEIDHTVDAVDDLDVVAEQLNPERCTGDADGTIRITVSGYTFDDGTTVTVGGDLNYVIIDPDTGLEVVDGLGGPIAGSSGTLTMTTDPQVFDLPFGAAADNYIVRVTQVGNPMCDEEDPVTIQGPPDFELIVPPFITTTCDVPLNNGSFTATTNGARGTVTYLIVETGDTSANGTFTDLGPTDPTTPRTYTVVARDTFTDPTSPTGTSFCEDTATIEVRPPANDVNITAANPFGVTCNGDVDGRIEVIATGTDLPLTYTITPAVTGVESDRTDNPNFTLLSPGDYIITVYDRSNCSDVSGTVNIPEPNPVNIIVDDVTSTTCTVTTADVTLTVTSDVAAPYTVEARDVTLRDEISTPSNPILDADRDRLVRQETTDATGTVTFTGLPEGIYEFFAIDGNTCESQRTGSVVIDAPDQIMAELDLSNTMIVCFGDATGSVNLISTTGGLGNNMYSLDVIPADTSIAPFTTPLQGDPFFTDLVAGQYIYRIESVPGSGCQFSAPFEITQPDTPFEATAEATNITCNGEDDGTITVTASGGNTNNPYRYSLFNSVGERVFEFVSDEADNVIGSHVFEDLAQDLTGYTVIAEDGLGCTVTITPVIIVEPAPILIDITATTAEVCAGDSDGTATFSITGGTANPDPTQPTYTWSINGIDFMPVTDPTNLFVEDLPSGTNTLYIRDFNGVACETPREFIIDPGVLLEAQLEERLICPIWSDPLADQVPTIITPQIYEVEFNISPETESLGVIYRLVRTDGSTGPAEYSGFQRVFEVTPGTYDAIMLFNMCERTVGTIVVPEYTPLDVPVVQMTGNPQDPNEYEILATGGNRLENDPFYTFFVALLEDGGTVNDIQYPLEVEDNTFAIRETGDYLIRVIDASGCEVSVILNLTYINIRIPNYFTPDSPTATPEERFWYPRQITPNIDDPFFFENMEVMVFDRYGRMLAEFRGDQQGWDGLYQGKQLPSGDYWFTIQLNDVDSREFTGHFTLYR